MTLTPFPMAFAGVGEPEKEASDSPASSSAERLIAEYQEGLDDIKRWLRG